MANYTMTKDFSNAKVKTAAKSDIINELISLLSERYGDDSVAMIRTKSGQSYTNEIGVIVGTVDKNGDELPLIVTINPVVKEFETRKTAKKSYVPFDFAEAKGNYEDYLVELEEKNSGKEKKKSDDEVVERKTEAADNIDNDVPEDTESDA